MEGAAPVGTSSWLATILDAEMIAANHRRRNSDPTVNAIAPVDTPDQQLPLLQPADLVAQLGGRCLLYYVHAHEAAQRIQGRSNGTFVSPTPYAPEEATSCLALPIPAVPREYVILLDPARLTNVRGPRRVRFGTGIEYLLESGFPVDAVIPVATSDEEQPEQAENAGIDPTTTRWPIKVR